jgi:hypothetical protein
VAHRNQFQLHSVTPAFRQTRPRQPGVSVTMLRQRQKFQGFKKLSSIHNLKFLALSTLSVVAG